MECENENVLILDGADESDSAPLKVTLKKLKSNTKKNNETFQRINIFQCYCLWSKKAL